MVVFSKQNADWIFFDCSLVDLFGYPCFFYHSNDLDVTIQNGQQDLIIWNMAEVYFFQTVTFLEYAEFADSCVVQFTEGVLDLAHSFYFLTQHMA